MTDPLAAADPTSEVEVTFTLGAAPVGVTVERDRTVLVGLRGAAAAVTAALDGLRYDAVPGRLP